MNGQMHGSEVEVRRRRREDNRSKRRALEEQIRQCSEQITALERRLQKAVAGQGHKPLAGPAKQHTSLGKRPASKAPSASQGQPREKRQRVEAERERRVASIFSQCSTIVRAIQKHKDAWPFHKPVDPVAQKCPDYFAIIKHPMDLGTVSKNLDHKPEKGKFRAYKDIYGFKEDMRLIWANCRMYNAVGTQVRAMGDNMSDLWEKRWEQSGLEKKWEEEMQRQREEDEALDGGGAVAHSRERPSGPAPDKAPPVGPDGVREMTFEEKRRLSQNLGNLPGDKVAQVLQIIEESQAELPKDESGEVELDIDQLDSATLWKLDKYVNEVLNAAAVKRDGANGQLAGGTGRGGDAVSRGGDSQLPDEGNSAGARGGSAAFAANGSSSSGSDSDSDSEEEVAQNDMPAFGEAGAPKAASRAADGHDISTLVSATQPSQPHILKGTANRKEIQLQNANAWSALTAEPMGEGEPGDGEGAAAEGDELWNEFQGREQQLRKREAEKREEEDRMRAQREQREAEARAEAARAKAAVKAEEAERQAQEEEAVAAQRAQREQERAAELAQLQEMQGKVDFTSQQAALGSHQARGPHALSSLGLRLRHDDEDDDDNSEGQDAQEEGEVA